MKIQPINQRQRSRRRDHSRLNLFQTSLITALLLNLAMTLLSPTARASETEFSNSPPPAPIAELPPTEEIAPPSLEVSADAVSPMVVEIPGAIAPSNSLAQPTLSIESAPAFMPVTEVAPTPQSISKQASDLAGVNSPQTSIPATLAQTESAPTDSSSEAKPVNNPLIPPPGWRFDFEPFLFLPLDVKGDIFFGKGRNLLFPDRPGAGSGGILGDRGINLNVNARLSDLRTSVTSLFGISGRFQAWNGNFGIVSEGLYVNSELRGSSDRGVFTFRDRFNLPIPGFQIDTRNTLASFALAASYRFLTVPFRTITDPADARQYYPAISFEALAGFRYLSVFQDITFERGPSFEFSGSEVNPMIGGTTKLMLSDKFALFFRGDTSNLGGGNLKQYYNLHAGVDWKFSGSFALRLAYRFNQVEFVRQGRFGGDNGFNLRSQGVQLGVSWQF